MSGAPGPAEGCTLRVVVAGFWRRGAAALVDLAILAATLGALVWLGMAILGIHLPPGGLGVDALAELVVSGQPLFLGSAAAGSMIAFLYFFLFLAARGQTPGKRLLRVRVITTTGRRPGPLRAFGRTSSYAISATLLALGFLWIGFDREKRGLHDWLTGTYVVRA